jgi:hypothetical protein
MNRLAGLIAIFVLTTLSFGQDRAGSAVGGPLDTSLRRFEVGGQTAYIGLDNCGMAQSGCDQFGRGVGVAFNLNQHFAIDSSFIVMGGMPATRIGDPHDPSAVEPLAGGGISESLAGVKIESRVRHWGVFARVAPGVMSWKTGTVYGSINDFVIETGVGMEYSPSPRLHFRLENDELAIKYHQFTGGHCYPCLSPAWIGNDEVRAGVYLSIGKPMNWTPVNTHARPTHRFFDTANIALLLADALSLTADDMLTARNLHDGGQEGNPFSRPFVRNGWPGMTGQAVLSEGEKVGLMYATHRLHLHWLERIVPLWDMYGHATAANHNAQQE